MRKWLPEELEEIPCDFCGSREVSCEFIRADGMRVVECAVCGLAYLNPRPRAELIPEFYKEDYFTGASAERGEGGLKLNLDVSDNISDLNQKSIPRPIVIINEKFGGFKGKRVLEIGCATGDLLMQIRNEGADVKGIEISDFAADIARKRGLDVITGTIEDYLTLNQEPFDIVMAFEVIEHVLSPTSFLKFCSEIIRPGGLLLLSTPNYACAKRFGREWFGFNASFEHIWFFKIDILKEMAVSSNLEIVYWETNLFSGGPDPYLSVVQRYYHKVRKWFAIMNNLGLSKTIRMRQIAPLSFCPYGDGHTLFALFQKKDS